MTYRILYIEDDHGLAALLTRSLKTRGAFVGHVVSGEEAIAALAREAWDVIALDHNLIGETGLDVIARLKARGAHPPIIYVTGSDSVQTAVAALKAGASDYVWKDTEGHYRELLAQSIEAVIAQDALRRDKEQAESEVRAARDRAELLLTEVNHRVANSLAMVSALARLQASSLKDDASRDALKEMQARVAAIAAVHRHLYAGSGGDVSRIDLADYLGTLVRDLDATSRNISGQITVNLVRFDPVAVKADHAVSLGLIATELVTNAVKYAYPGGVGEVRVSLVRIAADAAELQVVDDGIGWGGEAGPAKGTGVGTKIITSLVHSLGAQIEYEKSSGTAVRVRFPCMPT
ncbi:MAG TPA: histidine kinase dimerization/phosphoacceptor domain -containing protein [Hyphomonadaceae bacterium]|jgi:two-component sensor histidine kinase|nr:histidine kinase dimerization/phosphoacceptor domain -containing protein [Hyphomonadaceae bacterium]